ncbi:MAG: sulfotransferase [Pseudomonadota bacterium]
MTRLEEKAVVLVAGQPKAGTTSLYNWLVQHPEVGAGKLKELRFFLDPEYPLPSPSRFDGRNLAAYPALFNNPERAFLLDASPDYIGCEAPLALPHLQPNSSAILIFREPVERLVSAYRYYRSNGFVPHDMTFDEYIARQDRDGVTATTQSPFRALDHCRRGYYIARWRAAYKDRLLVLEFEDIRRDPARVLHQVCVFLGLNAQAPIDLVHSNKTVQYRSANAQHLYARARRAFAQLTLGFPAVYRLVQPLGRWVNARLETEAAPPGDVPISAQSRATIQRYADAR